MSAEAVTPMPSSDTPQPKTRKKYHRRKRAARKPALATTPQKPVAEKKQASSSRIADELDTRILAAVKERTTVGAQLSQMQGLQAHYNMLNNEIESLLQLKERISGQGRVTISQPQFQPQVQFQQQPAAAQPQFGRDVPPGVGSIPARQPAPNPHGNVAEMITGEGGFS